MALSRHNSRIVEISESLPEDVILQEIGGRIASLRLNLDLTQGELAARAGLSKRSIERLESGEVGTQFSGFLRVCRVLGLLDRLDLFLPEPQISPIDLLKLSGKRRKRAARPTESKAKEWKWGEPT